MDKMAGMVKSRFVLFLVVFMGVLLVLGIWRFIGHLNTSEFCVSCHSMSFANQEYKESRHFISRSGVRAECSDCHVGMGIRKALVLKQLIPDLWAELIHPIKDKAEWEQRKALLAKKARKGLGCDPKRCMGCHDPDLMKPSNERGRVAHERIKNEGMGCIECHKNLAHAEAG